MINESAHRRRFPTNTGGTSASCSSSSCAVETRGVEELGRVGGGGAGVGKRHHETGAVSRDGVNVERVLILPSWGSVPDREKEEEEQGR